MILDMRYHLASLVAVFLALGLGILTGTSISSDSRILREQAALIDNIERQLGQLRGDRDTLTVALERAEADLALLKTFSGEVLPSLVKDKLAGLKVAVVNFDSDPNADSVEDVLQFAGATIVGRASVWPDEPASAGLLPGFQSDSPAVRSLVTGLSALRIDEEVQIPSSVQWRQPVEEKADWVVMVGSEGVQETARRVAQPLRQDGIRVLVAKTRTGAPRSIRTTGVNTVERADLPVGQVELVKRLAEGI